MKQDRFLIGILVGVGVLVAGVPLKVEIFGGKVHDKFAVIDVNGADPVVITGSYNWTASGADDNDENTLIIHNPQVAQALGVSRATVRTHLEHIYAKLDVSNRTEAVTEGIKKGLIAYYHTRRTGE